MTPTKQIPEAVSRRPDGRSSHRPLAIAHRGAAADAPENTLAAFELALDQGADAIELDVHLSADGVPVVIHDTRLDHTTSGRGLVRKHTATELRRLDAGSWFNRRHPARARAGYSGQRIPLLAEVLAMAGARQCRIFVEIKTGRKLHPDIEAKVVKAVHRAGVFAHTTIMSFDHKVLEIIRELDPEIALGTSFKRPSLALGRARSVDARNVVPHWALATPRFVRHAHKAGLHVIVWTVNEPNAMRRMLANGVDGIITDYPARLAEIIGGGGPGKEAGRWSPSAGTFPSALRISN